MIFIKQRDIDKSIRSENLASIIDADTSLLSTAELASITEFKSYLIGKYDVDVLFATVDDWKPATSYTENDVVYYSTDDEFYICKVATTLNSPSVVTDWDVAPDPRDPLVVEFMVDLILYRLHSRNAAKQIPEHRIVRRDDAVSFLKSAAKYTISVPWDQEPDTDAASLTWGSNTYEAKLY